MGFLSSLFGGGGNSKSSPPQHGRIEPYQPIDAPAFPDVPIGGFSGMGYNVPIDPMSMGTPFTGQGTGAPSWMSGNFAAPWWGQQAPNVGAAILQQQAPAAYAALGQPPPQVQQEAPPPAPTGLLEDPEKFKKWADTVARQTPMNTFQVGGYTGGGMSGGLTPLTKTAVTPQNSYSDYLNAVMQQKVGGPRVEGVQRAKGDLGALPGGLLGGYSPDILGLNALYGL